MSANGDEEHVVSLAEALTAAQAKMPTVKKDDTNPHFNSRFMSLDNLIAETRGVLNEHGLVITQLPVTNDNGLPVLRTIIMHGPSGEQLTGDTPLFLAQNSMQSFGAAITYARRYAWAAALGIAAEEDTDGGPPPAEKTTARMATKAQKGKLAVIVKTMDTNATPIPDDYAGCENWVDVLRQRLQDEYNVESRNELTVEQASDLIDWLEAQAIPF